MNRLFSLSKRNFKLELFQNTITATTTKNNGLVAIQFKAKTLKEWRQY